MFSLYHKNKIIYTGEKEKCYRMASNWLTKKLNNVNAMKIYNSEKLWQNKFIEIREIWIYKNSSIPDLQICTNS